MSQAGVPNTADATAPPVGRSFVDRVLGVLRLDASAYEDIASDPGSMPQAVAVVAAAAIGRAISAPGGPFSHDGLIFLVYIAALWPITSLLVLTVGRWFDHPSELARVARVLGFAMAPYALSVLGVVPVKPVQISMALFLATFVVGVRHGLRTTTGRAGFVCVVIALILVFAWMIYVYLTAS